jgi:hypothetical protein
LEVCRVDFVQLYLAARVGIKHILLRGSRSLGSEPRQHVGVPSNDRRQFACLEQHAQECLIGPVEVELLHGRRVAHLHDLPALGADSFGIVFVAGLESENGFGFPGLVNQLAERGIQRVMYQRQVGLNADRNGLVGQLAVVQE